MASTGRTGYRSEGEATAVQVGRAGAGPSGMNPLIRRAVLAVTVAMAGRWVMAVGAAMVGTAIKSAATGVLVVTVVR
jgi:hypothetical protein